MKYRNKIVLIEATQWHKNGNHPLDDVMRPFEDTGKIPSEPREGAVVRYFRHPNVNGNRSCEFCNDIMNNHGWMDTGEGGHTVCPGDWIITKSNGELHRCKPDIFAAFWEAVVE